MRACRGENGWAREREVEPSLSFSLLRFILRNVTVSFRGPLNSIRHTYVEMNQNHTIYCSKLKNMVDGISDMSQNT